MTRIILLATLLLTCCLGADDPFDAALPRMISAHSIQIGATTMKVILADGAPAPDMQDIIEAVNELRWLPSTIPDAIARVHITAIEAARNELTLGVQISALGQQSRGTLAANRSAALIKEFAQNLKQLVTSDGNPPPEQLREKLAAVDNQIAETNKLQRVLLALKTPVGVAAEARTGQITALRNRLENLETELAAKDMRRDALSNMIAQLKKEAERRADADEISQQLKELVKYRENEVARIEDMVKRGAASNSEVEDKKAAVAEARVRLLERRAELGRNELFGKLSDELAMVSVDRTELDLQGAALRDKLDRYSRALTDEKALQSVAGQTTPPSTQPDLSETLDDRLTKLRRQKFQLLIADVQQVP